MPSRSPSTWTPAGLAGRVGGELACWRGVTAGEPGDGTGGTTWSDALNGLYAIDGTSDTLYTLDPKTGAATKVVKLDKDFGSVGMELHPANNVIYACTTDAILYWVDPKTGKVTPIGPIGQNSSCTNLAAPWGPVKCVDG